MAAGRRWVAGEDSGSHRFSDLDLARHMAQVNNRLVRNQRSDLVDSFRDLSLRRVAFQESGAIAIGSISSPGNDALLNGRASDADAIGFRRNKSRKSRV